MEPESLADKRKSPRVPFIARVQIKTPAVEKFAEEFSGNISLGGMFIKTDKPPEVGTPVELAVIIVPAGTHLFDASGKVAWVRPRNDPDSGEPAGMGIEFTSMNGPSRKTLAAIVGMGGPQAA